jgi:hypothetical protein
LSAALLGPRFLVSRWQCLHRYSRVQRCEVQLLGPSPSPRLHTQTALSLFLYCWQNCAQQLLDDMFMRTKLFVWGYVAGYPWWPTHGYRARSRSQLHLGEQRPAADGELPREEAAWITSMCDWCVNSSTWAVSSSFWCRYGCPSWCFQVLELQVGLAASSLRVHNFHARYGICVRCSMVSLRWTWTHMLELGPASAMLLPGYAAADTCVPGAAVDALEIFGGSITR